MRTLGQKRAEFALNKVMELKEKNLSKFKPFSAGAPSMILQNGFGQALAFWASKGKAEHQAMLNIVSGWLCDNVHLVQSTETPAFLRELSTMDQRRYFEAQQETLAVLEWVKRYANAFLSSPNTD